jgi:hypothetical protein
MMLSYATQPTPRAVLAGICRIDIINQQAAPFGGVRHALALQPSLPLAEAAACAVPHAQLLGSLRQGQALEHQHRNGGCPPYQFGGGPLRRF